MVLFTRQKYLSRQLGTRRALSDSLLDHQPVFSYEQKLEENLAWYLCLNCLKCHFFLVFWKQAVNTFDFTLASFLQWSTNQCVLLCLHSQVLLQADFWELCQRKSIVFEMLASRQHHPTDSIREKRQTVKLQFIMFIWPYERNSLCWHNYHSWSSALRPQTCSLTPAPLWMSIAIN